MGSIDATAVISGNAVDGLRLYAPGTRVVRAFIGVGVDGVSAAGNQQAGISIQSDATDVQIGGKDSRATVVVGGNGCAGITADRADRLAISRANIGIGNDGLAAVGNGGTGIELAGVKHITAMGFAQLFRFDPEPKRFIRGCIDRPGDLLDYDILTSRTYNPEHICEANANPGRFGFRKSVLSRSHLFLDLVL